MSLFLSLDGAGTLQQRLVRALTAAILDGRLAAGARLPSTRELAREFGLARNTAVLAIEELVALGLAAPRARAGVFVADRARLAEVPAAPPPATPLPGLSERARRAQELFIGRARPAPELRQSFSYGHPLVPPALLRAWRSALVAAAEHAPLVYPDPAGWWPLRCAIAASLARRRGVVARPEQVVVVTGAQQAFDLCARLLLDPGDLAVIEDPHYEGLHQALVAAEARIHYGAVDEEGLRLDTLPLAGARLVCITPSHQFPTGVLLSQARREALLRWAAAHDAWVLEDDYDGEFRYGQRPAPAICSLPGGERVIYVGTFSKLLFPALRLGFIVLPEPLLPAFTAQKLIADRGSGVIEQVALARLLEEGAVDRHLRWLAGELRRRRSALLRALERYCGDDIRITGISAGMHVAITVPRLRLVDTVRLVEAVARQGVAVETVAPRAAHPDAVATLLLGYAAAPAEALAAAAEALGTALRQVLD
jgi:GntR family transcriptional regulator/MocR family aminotransferase